ncbi:MAG: hypothetical protein ACPGPS_07345 [Rubripirellula sp.]
MSETEGSGRAGQLDCLLADNTGIAATRTRLVMPPKKLSEKAKYQPERQA